MGKGIFELELTGRVTLSLAPFFLVKNLFILKIIMQEFSLIFCLTTLSP